MLFVVVIVIVVVVVIVDIIVVVVVDVVCCCLQVLSHLYFVCEVLRLLGVCFCCGYNSRSRQWRPRWRMLTFRPIRRTLVCALL